MKNLIKEIKEYTIKKNQTVLFVNRYKYELKSLYLKNLNNKRIKGEYPTIYKYFYKLVKSNFCITFIII